MIEQFSLFDNISVTKEEFAERILEEFNGMDTVWKGQFYIEDVELAPWGHIPDPLPVLTICLKAKNNNRNNNCFMQFEGDPESQRVVYNPEYFSDYIRKLSNDKDFAICVTPWNIYIFYHKFELKEIPAW